MSASFRDFFNCNPLLSPKYCTVCFMNYCRRSYNNKIIMLPNKNITKAISLYKKFETENKIGPDTIIDLRIENRLVLTNG